MKRVMIHAGLAAALLAGIAVRVRAQEPSPPGAPGAWMGGPMAGMFEMGGLMGGFGLRTVTGKPILASFTVVHTQTLTGNTISNTNTGTYARGADGSIYRDVKLTSIGPWSASGKVQEFIYIRNVSNGMQYIVNVTKGTYQAFPLAPSNPPPGGKKDLTARPDASNETVTDNPNGSFTDSVTNVVYPVDDRKTTRTIPAGAIGNQLPLVITSERWHSDALDLTLQNTSSDPRFGTTTYQLSNIGTSPAASLFVPDPSFTQVQGGGFGPKGHAGDGKQPPPPPDGPQN